MKVLVVDDDPFMRDVLTAVLEGDGYAVLAAESGAQALDAIRADGSIGLIISDLHMPEMSGAELLRRIRAAGSGVPVIILTGDDELPAGNREADDYLLKDEHIQDAIIPAVQNILKKRARG